MDTKQPNTPSAMTIAFSAFVLGAILFGSFAGRMQAVTDSSFQAAKDAVTLAIGLIGIMAFWLGMMKVLEAGGLVLGVARIVRPIMVRLFPDVPPEHPAMGAMTMNISANMLGLGNAATPIGIRAMTELNRLNRTPGVATDAMCLFLAINTSSVTLFPLGTIGVRAAAGSQAPAAIFLPTLLATTLSTATGIVVAKFLARRDRQFRAEFAAGVENVAAAGEEAADPESEAKLLVTPGPYSRAIGYFAAIGFLAAFCVALAKSSDRWSFLSNEFIGAWLMPGLILSIISYGLCRGVKIYEAVVEGAKQGFDVAVRIIPYLVAVMVAIGMFRASGAMELLATWVFPVTNLIAMPPETIPMALVRPLSGSGAFGIMSALVQESPDGYPAFVASVMMGAADTTFYILAVYFGAVGVSRIRHALAAGLAADIAGMIGACVFSKMLY